MDLISFIVWIAIFAVPSQYSAYALPLFVLLAYLAASTARSLARSCALPGSRLPVACATPSTHAYAGYFNCLQAHQTLAHPVQPSRQLSHSGCSSRSLYLHLQHRLLRSYRTALHGPQLAPASWRRGSPIGPAREKAAITETSVETIRFHLISVIFNCCEYSWPHTRKLSYSPAKIEVIP